MKTILYTTAAALIAIANPANAQILGGGGILGGSPMPTLPNIPAPMSMPMGSIGSVTNTNVTAATTATATKSVNPRTGQASANGSGTGSATGALSQTLDTPLNSVTANGTGSGSAAGSAGADAQLFGTDAVRGTLRQTRDAAGNIVTTFRNRAGNLSPRPATALAIWSPPPVTVPARCFRAPALLTVRHRAAQWVQPPAACRA